MSQLLQYVLSGITTGSVYAAVAVGFTIIYRTTGVLNFAQGEFVMLGGMCAVAYLPFAPLPVAVTAAVLTVGLAGAGMEWTFFRHLRRHNALQLTVITMGLSIVLREAALHIWDEKVRSLPPFSGSVISSITVCGASVSPQVLWVLGALALAVAGLQACFHYTQPGRAMRACAAQPEAALLCGINLARMRTLAFALSAALGALAGCVISPISMTQYDMGADLAIKGFSAAILGGLGNPLAAVTGGLLVGLMESLSVSVMPAAYKDVTAFVILIAVLLLRPHGLLGAGQSAHREC
ncbi:MAG: branched-chain amino acid ABC transporter permease [Kiritimatiellae bacterium]|nr:branched-chain amino acid ABC transporter permease [Kiritimatiellia bacterium]